MKMIFRILCISLIGLMALSCMGVPLANLAGPEPGTKGFYDVTPVEGRVATDDVIARKMSRVEDTIFVYRVDNYKVVLGYTSGSSAPKPFDEISAGVTITTDAANKLAAYLTKVIAQYDNTEKTNSLYMDFRFLVNDKIEIALTEETVEKEFITLRFQYIFNNTEEEDEELTLCFIGGGNPKELTYDEIKVLLENLKKK